jgi:hypothetical protein
MTLREDPSGAGKYPQGDRAGELRSKLALGNVRPACRLSKPAPASAGSQRHALEGPGHRRSAREYPPRNAGSRADSLGAPRIDAPSEPRLAPLPNLGRRAVPPPWGYRRRQGLQARCGMRSFVDTGCWTTAKPQVAEHGERRCGDFCLRHALRGGTGCIASTARGLASPPTC